MQVKRQENKNSVILECAGELDKRGVSTIADHLKKVDLSNAKVITLDFAGVTRADGEGLAGFLMIIKEIGFERITVTNAPLFMRKTFALLSVKVNQIRSESIEK